MTLIFISQNYDLWLCLHGPLKSTAVSTLGWACSPGQLLKISLEVAAGEAWLWYHTTHHPRPAEAMQEFLCNSLQVSLNRMNTVKLSESHLSGHQRTLKFLQGSLAWTRGWHVIQFGGNFNLRALKRPVGKQGGCPPSLTPKSFSWRRPAALTIAACDNKERGISWENQIVWIECHLLKGRMKYLEMSIGRRTHRKWRTCSVQQSYDRGLNWDSWLSFPFWKTWEKTGLFSEGKADRTGYYSVL